MRAWLAGFLIVVRDTLGLLAIALGFAALVVLAAVVLESCANLAGS